MLGVYGRPCEGGRLDAGRSGPVDPRLPGDSAHRRTTQRQPHWAAARHRPSSGDADWLRRGHRADWLPRLLRGVYRERLLSRLRKYDTIRDAILTCARKPT